MKMIKSPVIVFVMLLSSMLSFDVAAFAMGDAINIAGRQRMLSQRITQAYILSGIQPDALRHRELLDKSLVEFQQNLDKLDRFVEANPAKNQLREEQRIWQEFKIVANQPVDKYNARKLFELSNRLLPAAHAYVMALQNISGTKSAELVNISGRQRMLSQRMAKNYLAEYWGIADVDGLKELYSDLAEFDRMLDYLLSSELNTEKLKAKLLRTQGYLDFVSRGFEGEMSLSKDRMVTVIPGTTDIMLYKMDEITKMYAKLMNELAIQQVGQR